MAKTISDELNRLIQAKAGIKSALEEKGLTIGNSSTLDEFPGLIQEMEVGGGGSDTSTIIDLIEGDITSIDIPYGTTKIGNWKFYYDTSLVNVSIPNTVKELGTNCFQGCKKLYDVSIPESVEIIDNFAFSNTGEKFPNGNGWVNVNIPNNIKKLGNQTFFSNKNFINISFPDTLTEIGNGCFSGNINLSEIHFNDPSIIIGENAFQDTKISALNLNNGEFWLRTNAFANMTSLTDLIIDTSIYALQGSYGWFATNTSLEKVIIKNSSTLVQQEFLNCTKLKYVFLPENLTNIQANAFSNINTIIDFVFLGITPPTLAQNNVLRTPQNIFVKNTALDNYKSATGNWTSYTDKIKPLAAINYDEETLTVTALGRDNLELYIDGTLIDSSTYTLQDENIYNVTVKSVDPSLGVLDEVNEQIETPGYTGGDPEPAPDPEPEPEEPELEQLNPPEITITPDSNGYTVEITSTDNRANAIVYSIGDPNENENFDYTKPLLNKPEGTEIYAQARNADGEYADSDWTSAVVGE